MRLLPIICSLAEPAVQTADDFNEGIWCCMQGPIQGGRTGLLLLGLVWAGKADLLSSL